MRVLHLVDRFSDRGGAYTHLASLIRGLEAAGHETAVAAGESDRPTPARFYRVAGLAARTPAPVRMQPPVADFRPDVVHLHTVLNPTVLEWAAGVPAVITIQDHRYFCPAQGKWTRAGAACREPWSAAACAACFDDERYFREVLELTRARLEAVKRLRVVVLSRYMAAELGQAGVAPSRLTVVPPFSDLPILPRAAGQGHVALLGRLTESKGVRDSLAAWRDAGVGLPLVAAGTGPLRPWLEAEGVSVTGWLGPEELATFLASARAVVMTPRWQEPFGIAGLEAMSAGVPVAAWRSGGVEEWHPGPLPPWGDVAGVAEQLRAALRAGPVPEEQRLALRRRFARDRGLGLLVAVYRRAVGLP